MQFLRDEMILLFISGKYDSFITSDLFTAKSEQIEDEDLSEFYFDPPEDSIFRSRRKQCELTRSRFEASENIDFDADTAKLSELYFSLSES